MTAIIMNDPKVKVNKQDDEKKGRDRLRFNLVFNLVILLVLPLPFWLPFAERAIRESDSKMWESETDIWLWQQMGGSYSALVIVIVQTLFTLFFFLVSLFAIR